MSVTTVLAHFDGKTIVLDEPVELEPDTWLLITIIPKEQAEQIDSEREDWLRLAEEGLSRAYGDDEPEYNLDMIKEPNPEYRRRST